MQFLVTGVSTHKDAYGYPVTTPTPQMTIEADSAPSATRQVSDFLTEMAVDAERTFSLHAYRRLPSAA